MCNLSSPDYFSDSCLIAGGWWPEEEEGDLSGCFSLFTHGNHAHEGWRPKHPRAGTLRTLLCHRSHHWQAGDVETDRAQWQTNGVACSRGCLLIMATGRSSGFYVDFSFLFLCVRQFHNGLLDGKSFKTKEDPKLKLECEHIWHRSFAAFFLWNNHRKSVLSVHPSFLNDLPQLIG